MPEVLEAPPTQPRHLPEILKPFTWTREEAVQAAHRSAILRSQRAAERKLTDSAEPTDLSAQLAVNGQLRLVAEQVTRTRALLNDDDYRFCKECERGGIEPHHRAQLLKALDTLLDRQRVLLGIPLPGNRRPSSDKQERRRILDLAPVGIAGQILDVAQVPAASPARPAGWEYDDPPGLVRVPESTADTTTGSVQPPV